MTTREPTSAATPVGDVSIPQQRTAPVQETAVREDVVRETPAGAGRDRVRWGPIWAGAIVTITTFLVLQLLFFALGWLDLGFDGGASGTATAIVSGVLGLIAFFVGGLMAGASSMWRSAGDGALHGVLTWALSVAGILGLALIGGSALLGPLANIAAQAPAVTPQDVDVAQAVTTARQSAGWTALGLGLAVAAAAIGGMTGSKIWPGRRSTHTVH
ncbi:hypothetical protein [Pseudonocardia nigra]|uniref:hypothetical protein n=1 Tax=Pseudonocardia nigra TaxID=1921578 RepID=UPI001C5F4E59|nr:hypothetical protein [Pseudonocardia nigra]